MRAIRAVIEGGNMILEVPLQAEGRVGAVLLLLDAQPWDAVAYDPDACPEPARASRESVEEFADIDPSALNVDSIY
jgi:hypothetical protein